MFTVDVKTTMQQQSFFFFVAEEQIVILDDASSVKSDGSSRSNKNIRKKQEPQRNKTERDLPTKPKIKGNVGTVFLRL